MIYDISVLSFWLFLAFALGLAVGWLVWAAQATSWSDSGLRLAVVLFVVGVLLAWMQVLPGRLGFFLDALLLMTAVYAVGLMLGDVARTAFLPGARRAADV